MLHALNAPQLPIPVFLFSIYSFYLVLVARPTSSRSPGAAVLWAACRSASTSLLSFRPAWATESRDPGMRALNPLSSYSNTPAPQTLRQVPSTSALPKPAALFQMQPLLTSPALHLYPSPYQTLPLRPPEARPSPTSPPRHPPTSMARLLMDAAGSGSCRSCSTARIRSNRSRALGPQQQLLLPPNFAVCPLTLPIHDTRRLDFGVHARAYQRPDPHDPIRKHEIGGEKLGPADQSQQLKD
ncbi:hypothetical protein BJ742DRAFT_871088 [Cladochytrium replicatum]|nr:hypothetical protein BJ742DRAFT_871088 [Cladochytrium replicatum]